MTYSLVTLSEFQKSSLVFGPMRSEKMTTVLGPFWNNCAQCVVLQSVKLGNFATLKLRRKWEECWPIDILTRNCRFLVVSSKLCIAPINSYSTTTWSMLLGKQSDITTQRRTNEHACSCPKGKKQCCQLYPFLTIPILHSNSTFLKYRPGQPNWVCTMGKFQDSSYHSDFT